MRMSIGDQRKIAEQKGEKYFNTGRPCRHGHTSDRYTSSSNCVVCVKTTTYNHHNSTKEELKERAKNRKKVIKDHIAAKKRGDLTFTSTVPCVNNHLSPRYTLNGTCLECQKIFREVHKEENAQRSQQYRDEDPEGNRAYMKEYMRKYRLTEKGHRNMTKAQLKYDRRIREEMKQDV